jgi:hypothetical protein
MTTLVVDNGPPNGRKVAEPVTLNWGWYEIGAVPVEADQESVRLLADISW